MVLGYELSSHYRMFGPRGPSWGVSAVWSVVCWGSFCRVLALLLLFLLAQRIPWIVRTVLRRVPANCNEHKSVSSSVIIREYTAISYTSSYVISP
ncbi:hypothetical protein GDO78_022438 [Eleutherodactylus coqui]|uniref:Uncharacterized protein n=1 Tax=Eleutherodactylus coqui TaxID=57060 RepID=A0A8J6BGE3_ELECQ|nr:hypothetical protein GDO78_022438 [Eleutherodactylus coqui]